MKRAATLVLVMSASATVDARALASKGPKPQWAPTRNFSSLNARAVFASESRRATSPYAGEEGETAAGAKEAAFTGHRLEDALGLSYAQRRWLDSTTGTWLSRDDVGAASYLQSPNELNQWLYAAGNPTRYTDPSGRFIFDSNGYFEVQERDSTTRLELLVGFLQMKDSDGALGFNSHLSRFVAQREATALVGGSYDTEGLYRAQLVSLLQSYFQDSATANARFNNQTRLAQQLKNLNGLSGADEGAEATVLVASLLGTPTSKQDVAVMVAIPVAAGVIKFGAKKGIGLLRRVLGRNPEAAANALSEFRTPRHGGGFANEGGEFLDAAPTATGAFDERLIQSGVTDRQLRKAASEPHVVGERITKAGRAVSKHPEVFGLTKQSFQAALRTDSMKNEAAERLVDELLASGSREVFEHPRYGQILELRLPDGRGARFKPADGRAPLFVRDSTGEAMAGPESGWDWIGWISP